LGFVGIASRETHTAKPVEFGAPIALIKSFSEPFRLVDCLKSFKGKICQVQSFSLNSQESWQAYHRADGPIAKSVRTPLKPSEGWQAPNTR
jgi:hypothetical protein